MQIHGVGGSSQSPWLSTGSVCVGAVDGNYGSEKWLIEFIEESPLRALIHEVRIVISLELEDYLRKKHCVLTIVRIPRDLPSADF